jgi:hypothetical protein
MKAYDLVRWDFLLAILLMVGFPSRMVNLIGECISTTRFSVSINRELHGFFTGSGGFKQGIALHVCSCYGSSLGFIG